MSCLYGIFDHSEHIIFSWNFRSLFVFLNLRGGWGPLFRKFSLKKLPFNHPSGIKRENYRATDNAMKRKLERMGSLLLGRFQVSWFEVLKCQKRQHFVFKSKNGHTCQMSLANGSLFEGIFQTIFVSLSPCHPISPIVIHCHPLSPIVIHCLLVIQCHPLPPCGKSGCIRKSHHRTSVSATPGRDLRDLK